MPAKRGCPSLKRPQGWVARSVRGFCRQDRRQRFYNGSVKTWDVIIVGGGIIGLSLSIALRKRGASVLLVERGEPGREASHAAGGMLVDCSLETPPALQPLATASARMYPEFAHELQDESGVNVDLRDQGALFSRPSMCISRRNSLRKACLPARLAELEPALALADPRQPAFFLKERSVDPRALTSATLKAAKHRGVDIASGTAVTAVLLSEGRAAGVSTEKTSYLAPAVVNCAGAWAGQIPPQRFPTRPVKGQMLCVLTAHGLLRHVLRAPDVYVIPRSDGRILIGATVEEAGYDKRARIRTPFNDCIMPPSVWFLFSARRACTMRGPGCVPARPIIFRFSAPHLLPAISWPPDTSATEFSWRRSRRM